MSKLFYDHLVIREELTADIDIHALDPESRQELLELVDEILNHHVLNVILSHLPKTHHSQFISHFTKNPGNADLLSFLKNNVTVNIEAEIKKHLIKIKDEIKTEIKKSKSR